MPQKNSSITAKDPILCQYCGTEIEPDSLVFCSKCQTAHHRDCWHEADVCTTFACGSTRALEAREHYLLKASSQDEAVLNIDDEVRDVPQLPQFPHSKLTFPQTMRRAIITAGVLVAIASAAGGAWGAVLGASLIVLVALAIEIHLRQKEFLKREAKLKQPVVYRKILQPPKELPRAWYVTRTGGRNLVEFKMVTQVKSHHSFFALILGGISVISGIFAEQWCFVLLTILLLWLVLAFCRNYQSSYIADYDQGDIWFQCNLFGVDTGYRVGTLSMIVASTIEGDQVSLKGVKWWIYSPVIIFENGFVVKIACPISVTRQANDLAKAYSELLGCSFIKGRDKHSLVVTSYANEKCKIEHLKYNWFRDELFAMFRSLLTNFNRTCSILFPSDSGEERRLLPEDAQRVESLCVKEKSPKQKAPTSQGSSQRKARTRQSSAANPKAYFEK